MSYSPNNPNGQATSANSAPVVIASDQSSLPVSFTTSSEAGLQIDIRKVGGNVVTTTVPVSGTVTATVASSTLSGLQVNITKVTTASLAGTKVFVENQMSVTLASTTLSGLKTNETQIKGVAISTSNGTVDAGTQRVAIASDNTAFSVNATLSAETTKVIGVVRNADGSGNLLTSTGQALDVNLKTSSITLGVSLTSTTQSGLQVDLRKIAGSSIVTGGVTGSQGIGGATAVGQPIVANPVNVGGRASTALSTTSTVAVLNNMVDKFGRQITIPMAMRDIVGTQTTTISASTSETTIITAGAAGVFKDIVLLVISNTSASTNTRIDFRDATAGTILFSMQSIGGAAPIGFSMATPIPQTAAANNWTAQAATSTTDLRVYAVFISNK